MNDFTYMVPAGKRIQEIEGTLPETNTILEQINSSVSGSSLSAKTVDATTSGDTVVAAITNTPKLFYISLSANGANTADVTVIVKIGTSEKYKVSLKPGGIWARNVGAGRNFISGSTGEDIIINLSTAQTVHASIEYADTI